MVEAWAYELILRRCSYCGWKSHKDIVRELEEQYNKLEELEKQIKEMRENDRQDVED